MSALYRISKNPQCNSMYKQGRPVTGGLLPAFTAACCPFSAFFSVCQRQQHSNYPHQEKSHGHNHQNTNACKSLDPAKGSRRLAFYISYYHHRIAVAEKSVSFIYGSPVCFQYLLSVIQGRYQHHQR